MYVIMGCGKVGARVADLLLEAGKEVVLVDSDATRVEALQERKFNVIHDDMTKVDLRKEPFTSAEAFLILSGDDQKNLATVKAIKKALNDTPLIVRASSPAGAKELKDASANYVVQAPDVVGSAVVKELTELELFKKTDALVRIIKQAGEGGLGIVLHNSPDPDSIAGGLALQKIAEKYRIKSFIYYGGKIGHQQNRALVNLIGVKMKQITPGDDVNEIIKRHGKTAIIDCEIAGQNNVLPRGYMPSVVVGHHITSTSGKIPGEFVDVRQNVGAVSTILLGYLQELSIVPDPKLAGALLYGIRVDTANLTRHTSPSDLKAVAYLSPLVDEEFLTQLETPPMSGSTLDTMGRAITNRLVRGTYMVSNCGFLADRDSLPQAAEFLLKLEGVSTTLCFGIADDMIHVSARSKDSRLNLGETLQKAFGEKNAGGHAQSAGGAIPLGILGDTDDKEELLGLVEKAVTKQFFSAVGAPEEKEEEEPTESKPREPTRENGAPPSRRSLGRRIRA
jgi:nanoRNase/pAp phosphatase (c-di-AMP/oligoRNAs hydrolase)